MWLVFYKLKYDQISTNLFPDDKFKYLIKLFDFPAQILLPLLIASSLW